MVERRRLSAPGTDRFLRWLEGELSLPVMLVARDEASIIGARTRAEFDAKPYLLALMRTHDIEWTELNEAHFEEDFN